MRRAQSAFHTLRRFAAASIAISPRHTTEAAIVTLVLSATESVGLLLLIPLLQLVGVDSLQQGALSSVISVFETAFGVVGL